jgi:putative ABC transport system permease protein
VAIGVFSSAMLTTIDRGQEAAAWQRVGSDVQLVAPAGAISEELGLEAIQGVSAVARLHRAEATLGRRGGVPLTLQVVDPDAYQRVTEGTPADANLPGAMRDITAEGDAVPALVSRTLARGGADPMRVGDTFDLAIAGRRATFRIVQIRNHFAGLPIDERVVLVPVDGLRAALPDRALPTNAMLLRADATAANAISAAVEEGAGFLTVTDRRQVLADLRSAPLVRAVAGGFALAVGLAMAYAALALSAALALAAGARAWELAQLRTMGLTRTQVLGLAVVEHGPALLTAIAAGTVLGLAVAWLVLPGIGLEAFIGSDVAVALSWEPRHLGLVAGGLVAVVALAIAVSSAVARRMGMVRATREGQA